MTDLPNKRFGSCLVTLNYQKLNVNYQKTVLIWGGSKGIQSTIYSLDTSRYPIRFTPITLHGADKVEARGSFAYCQKNELVYIYGGYMTGKVMANDLIVMDFHLNTVRVLNAINAPPAMLGSTLVYHEDEFTGVLVLYGGLTVATKCSDAVYRIPLDSLRWEPVKTTMGRDSCPAGRESHNAFLRVENGDPIMYVFGGFILRPTVQRSRDFLKLNLITKRWDMLQFDYRMLPVGRSMHAAVYHNDKLYIHGGYMQSRNDFGGYVWIRGNDFWVYNFITNQWERKSASFGERAGHCATVVDNTMIMFGGTVGREFSLTLTETSNDVYCLSLEKPRKVNQLTIIYAQQTVLYWDPPMTTATAYYVDVDSEDKDFQDQLKTENTFVILKKSAIPSQVRVTSMNLLANDRVESEETWVTIKPLNCHIGQGVQLEKDTVRILYDLKEGLDYRFFIVFKSFNNERMYIDCQEGCVPFQVLDEKYTTLISEKRKSTVELLFGLETSYRGNFIGDWVSEVCDFEFLEDGVCKAVSMPGSKQLKTSDADIVSGVANISVAEHEVASSVEEIEEEALSGVCVPKQDYMQVDESASLESGQLPEKNEVGESSFQESGPASNQASIEFSESALEKSGQGESTILSEISGKEKASSVPDSNVRVVVSNVQKAGRENVGSKLQESSGQAQASVKIETLEGSSVQESVKAGSLSVKETKGHNIGNKSDSKKVNEGGKTNDPKGKGKVQTDSEEEIDIFTVDSAPAPIRKPHKKDRKPISNPDKILPKQDRLPQSEPEQLPSIKDSLSGKPRGKLVRKYANLPASEPEIKIPREDKEVPRSIESNASSDKNVMPREAVDNPNSPFYLNLKFGQFLKVRWDIDGQVYNANALYYTYKNGTWFLFITYLEYELQYNEEIDLSSPAQIARLSPAEGKGVAPSRCKSRCSLSNAEKLLLSSCKRGTSVVLPRFEPLAE